MAQQRFTSLNKMGMTNKNLRVFEKNERQSIVFCSYVFWGGFLTMKEIAKVLFLFISVFSFREQKMKKCEFEI